MARQCFDGNALLPIDNQPRLDLKQQLEDGTLLFKCVSATHLESFKDPNENAFKLKMIDDGSLYRAEAYVEADGQLKSNGIAFHKMA